VTGNAFSGSLDGPRASIWRLAERLKGVGYDPEVADDEPTLKLFPPKKRPPIKVACCARTDDGNRLWFYCPPGEPLAEVGDPDVISHIKGLMAAT
jgi:hypothetical protein